METSVNNGMCRCCASEGTFKDVRSTYHWMGEEEIYADMLKECFDILLSKSEADNAGGICEVCITQLRNAANFKKQVLHTEEQFKKHFHNKIFKPIKLEVSRDGDELESDNNLSDDFSTDFDLPIKEEIEEPKPKKRTSAVKATTSKAKKAKVEGETSVKHVCDGYLNKETTTEETVAKEQRNTITTIKKDRMIPKLVPISKGMSTKTNKSDLPEIAKRVHNLTTILKNSNATTTRQYTDLKFFCSFCFVGFDIPAELKTHTLMEHSDYTFKIIKWLFKDSDAIKLDITELKCNICHNDIDGLEDLISHLTVEHDQQYFMDICNTFLPFKFDKKEPCCTVCKGVFHSFHNLKIHMNSHFKNYTCDVCDRSFVTKISFVSHKRRHKTGSFACSFCPEMFDVYWKKTDHELKYHKSKNRFICPCCPERFPTGEGKKAHMLTVHGVARTTVPCKACDKSFYKVSALRRHVKTYHLMERNYECETCAKTFSSAKDLKNHSLRHTGEKKFQCNICLKSYSRRYTLKEHMRIHNNDRKFKCEHCSQSFVQKCSLKGHLKSKHNEIYEGP